MKKLSYRKLRQAVKLLGSNEKIKNSIDGFINGNTDEISLGEAVNGIIDSEIDLELVSITTGKTSEEIEEMEASEVMQEISDFFMYIMSNLQKLTGLLGTSRLINKVGIKPTSSSVSNVKSGKQV